MSSFVYVNRKGQEWYLYEGKTKSGKAKYYMAKAFSPTGKPLSAVPEGHEIYELPSNGSVVCRRQPPILIDDEELRAVQEELHKLGKEYCIVERKLDTIIVHADNTGDEMGLRDALSGWSFVDLGSIVQRNRYYQPLFRFTLSDPTKRLFIAERWCFKGSIDGWFELGMQPSPLEKLAKAYLRHLNQESFYELL